MSQIQGTLRSLIAQVSLVMITTLIVLMILSFPIGAFAFYDGRLGTSHLEFVEFPAFLVGLPIGLISGITIGDAFAMLWILYLVLFAIALNGPSSSIIQVIRKIKNQRTIPRNGAVSIVIAFSLVYLFSTIIEFIQAANGVRSGSLQETRPLVAFVTISLAPLTEEIGFRISTIGFFAFAAVSSQGILTSFKALWHPERYIVAIKSKGVSQRKNLRTLYAVALISGIFFGFAHLLYGGGWEIGKVTTASLAGVTLGVMYIKFGIPAAILVHWSFNYFRSAYFYFGNLSSMPNLTGMIDILVLITGGTSILLILSNLWFSHRGNIIRSEEMI